MNNSIDTKAIAWRVQEAVNSKFKTQTEFLAAANDPDEIISQSAFNKIWNSNFKQINISHFAIISQLTGKSLDWLLTGENYKSESEKEYTLADLARILEKVLPMFFIKISSDPERLALTEEEKRYFNYYETNEMGDYVEAPVPSPLYVRLLPRPFTLEGGVYTLKQADTILNCFKDIGELMKSNLDDNTKEKFIHMILQDLPQDAIKIDSKAVQPVGTYPPDVCNEDEIAAISSLAHISDIL